MKKVLMMVILAALSTTSAMALSVVNSPHDMIAGGFVVATGGAADEVCIFCHTPHGALTSVTQAQLWNNTPAADLSTFYTSLATNFASSALKINATDARLCLGCHDSGVSVDLINQPNVGSLDLVVGPVMSADALLGTNMANDHPVGMDLIDGQDTAIRTIALITTSFGNVNPFKGGAATTMWCSSCHNVHDNVNAPFLRLNNDASALCKACHIK